MLSEFILRDTKNWDWKICGLHVKEFPEICTYFPNFENVEIPDWEFFWSVIASVCPDATKRMIKEARENRILGEEEDKDNLFEVHLEILNEVYECATQKRKYYSFHII